MELIKRSITGILFVAAIVSCIVLGDNWMFWLFAASTLFVTIEFICLVNKHKECKASVLLSSLLALLFYIAVTGIVSENSSDPSKLVGSLIPFIIVFILVIISELYRFKGSHIPNLTITVFPVIYIALPFGLLNGLEHFSLSEQNSWIIPLSLFIFIWTNDVGAYCVGCTIGKHRLCERISPKKSWEGSIGGATFTVLAALIIHRFEPGYSIPVWIGMALTIVIFGTFGDLAESLIKRELGVKDSGNILPGHGGFLDRFDSTLLATPAVFTYLYLVVGY